MNVTEEQAIFLWCPVTATSRPHQTGRCIGQRCMWWRFTDHNHGTCGAAPDIKLLGPLPT